MSFSAHIFFSLLIYILASLAQARDQSGFISIDCGNSISYTDTTTDINYLPDEAFTEAGENWKIKNFSSYADKQLQTVRSFPRGTRNCYSLRPERGKGYRYLIRARFMYGNYDEKLKAPTFDLYLGAYLWSSVRAWNSWTQIYVEVIYVPLSDHINVCLVNIGNGIPFISALELRHIQNEIYLTEAGKMLKLHGRYDLSSDADEDMRYTDDIYDRLWVSRNKDNWKPYILLSDERSLIKNVHDFALPFTVMSTAYTANISSDFINLEFGNMNRNSRYCFYMHFAELEKLDQNSTREFNVYVNDGWWFGPVKLQYLTMYSLRSGSLCDQSNSDGKITVSLNNTDASTLPPLINAIEAYELIDLLYDQHTNETDVDAILGVKSAYRIKKIDWQGDPCVPEAYRWDGLNCSSTPNSPHRIISLNLSSTGLSGEIAPSISNLTMLQYLDLSNNKLEGTVPEFLGHLKFLRVLNLRGNNFMGNVPDALNEKWKNGDLILSINDPTSPLNGKSNKFVIPLVSSLGAMLFVVIASVFLLWIIRRKRQRNVVDLGDKTRNSEDRSFVSKGQRFSYSEIQSMTNNFERVLGHGAFGKVYHGWLNDTEVAVKMVSPSSLQGQRHFHVELKLLLRVHHKNLTTLVGYCKEDTNIGLIYEYMAMGDLRSHLSGNHKNTLSWHERLRIAIDTAQGLEYLHNGCKPPIIHRDVKSTNILLNERLQAKLGDFGLSKIFPNDVGRHLASIDDTNNVTPGVSASVAGTPGYLDPEYYISNWLNEKSDVYSFGVVLLEIITARPVLAKTRENNHIIEWVDSMLSKGDIKNIIDPRIEGDYDSNMAWKAVEIAMACVSRTSTNRPTMNRVAIELKECLEESTRKQNSRDAAESQD